ncbi:MAG: DNA polymerase III subunit gamma/tau [Clostridia bacterium]|nr:DNA polymerase III subunit gamma/tau [Clostridia bacterium]
MYQALYRSFRPETFDTLIGQEHIVKILKSQIESGSVGHAYIFCGTRGTGKTTTARLLAKALNCTSEKGRPCGECEACKAIAAGNFIDVIEMDAASNNGVDDIRSLRDEVNFPPVVGRTKVYIIDEAHMLSGAAANAFLKTLEEPPANTVFILATTEPNKLPATILSRCIRLDFKRVPEAVLKERFAAICKEIGVEAADDALSLIASNADGSVRDGLSLLDRCVSGTKKLTRDDVLFLLGVASIESFIDLTDAVLDHNASKALSVLSNILSEGKEALQITRDWVEHFRNLMIIRYSDSPEKVLNLSLENIERLKAQSQRIDVEGLSKCITKLSSTINEARWAPKPRILLELAIIELCQ